MLFTSILSISLALVGSVSAHSDSSELVKRQRSNIVQCAAAKYEDVPRTLKGCNFINLYNITVPAGKTLDLSGALPNTIFFFGREIRFGYKRGFAGPLIRFKGSSGLYVNGGTANLLSQGQLYYGRTGTRPLLVEIDGVSNSVFEKFNITNSASTAIHVKNSRNLQFKRPRVVNLGGDGNIGLRITNSRDISVTDGNIITQADAIQINSGSGLSISNTNLTYAGLAIGATSGTVDINNVKVSGVQVALAKTGFSIASPPTGAGVRNVEITSSVIANITGVGIKLSQNTKASSQAPLTGIKLTNIKGSVTSTAQKYQFSLAANACRGITALLINITGGKTSACSCSPTGFQCR